MEKRDIRDRTVLITGATSGIGKATALALAQLGATVVMVARDANKGAAVRMEIVSQSGNPHVGLMLADMASLAEVRRLAEEVRTTHSQLHVLINNAGIMPEHRTLTKDGYESAFAVNFLAPFLLTNQLLPLLKASGSARIVNVATRPLLMRNFDFTDVQGEKHFSAGRAYAQSKLALVMFTYALAQRLVGSGVTANALDPGTVRTAMMDNFNRMERHGVVKLLQFLIQPLLARIMPSADEGARIPVYLASAPEVAGVSGAFFNGKQQAVKTSKISYQETDWDRLWQVAEHMTGLQ